MAEILQIIIILFGPIPLIVYLHGSKVGKVLSPVVMAYAVGIAIVTFDIFPTNLEISKQFSELSIMLAIPLLLFSADIVSWFKNARSTVLSFLFAIIAALVSCVGFGFLFSGSIDTIWNYSAMLTGVYTGGTANMTAVGIAIDAPDGSFALINSVEILCGGLYLLFLTSIAPLLFGKFLPKYKSIGGEDSQVVEEKIGWTNWNTIAIAIALAIGILAVTLGLEWVIAEIKDKLFPNGIVNERKPNTTIIILILTTFSVVASLFPKIRTLKGSFEAGDYLLLVFCIAVGMRSDFGDIMDKGGMLLAFTACTWLGAVIIHFVLSVLFKIDRDTTLITSTAALYGPAFIGQIASVLGNRQIVFAGIATGLVGYAVGNYLGILVHYFLQLWLS